MITPSCPRPLVLGFGSPHGDDQAGWEVVRELESRFPPSTERRCTVDFHCATGPHELLNWIAGDRTTHLIDAALEPHDGCQLYHLETKASGEFTIRSDLPHAHHLPCDLSRLRCHSSHQYGLLESLALAGQLGMLPKRLSLWTIATPGETRHLRAATRRSIAQCAERIATELLPVVSAPQAAR